MYPVYQDGKFIPSSGTSIDISDITGFELGTLNNGDILKI